MSGEAQKAAWEDSFEMEPEYDFSDGVPNPYAARFSEGSTLVVVEPDVAAVFPNAELVNEALRLLIKTAKSAQELQKAS
jgi:hypothetical protein